MPELRPVYPLADARNAIIEAAIARFAERGFHGTTMRDIAERAGVSQGLLHHHFGNKEGLWNTVGDRISADFMDYVAPALDRAAAPEAAIPAALRTYLAYWREHPAAFRFNLWRLLEGPKGERAARSSKLTAHSVPLFKLAQDAGYLRGDLPPGLSMIIAGALIQFWLHSQTEIGDALAVTGDVPPPDDAFIETILGLVRAHPTKAPARAARAKKP